MIISFVSQKGGTGKSTICSNVAVAFSKKKKDVLIVDADPQKSISLWNGYREETRYPKITCIQKTGNLTKTLKEMKKKFDVVLVDCSGADSLESRSALVTSNLMISPVGCSQLDLDTLPKVIQTIEEASTFNTELISKFVLSRSPTRYKREINETKKYLSDIGIQPLQSIIYERTVYRDAITNGSSILEMNDAKAKIEFNEVFKEVLQCLKEKK